MIASTLNSNNAPGPCAAPPLWGKLGQMVWWEIISSRGLKDRAVQMTVQMTGLQFYHRVKLHEDVKPRYCGKGRISRRNAHPRMKPTGQGLDARGD